MRPIEASLLSGRELYREVILEKLAHARESVLIATANVKDMQVEVKRALGLGPRAPAEPDAQRRSSVGATAGGDRGRFTSITTLFNDLASRGVELRLLHAELPSRPFRRSFDRRQRLVRGGLSLKICPRVHFKTVLVDNAWAYLGSANLTGAGLGAKADGKRNFELGFVTEDFDTIDRVKAMFEAVWSGAECGPCKLRSVCPDPIGEAPKRSLVRLGRARRLY